jgi:hypothetical protein
MYREQSDETPDRFYAQFEWDGANAIYRRNQVGPAYRVTNDEYHRFVEDHDRRRKWINWASLLAGLILLAVVSFVPPFSTFPMESPTRVVLFSIALLLPLLSWSSARRWLRLVPARALSDRSPVAAALSKDERSSVWASNRPWPTLFGQAFVMGLMILNQTVLTLHPPAWDNPGTWMAIVGTALLLDIFAQMLRKRRIDRRHGIAGQTANNLT